MVLKIFEQISLDLNCLYIFPLTQHVYTFEVLDLGKNWWFKIINNIIADYNSVQQSMN
jgi:hypothetical protein